MMDDLARRSPPCRRATASVSAGSPTAAEGDESWPAWAGVVPSGLVMGTPEPDEHVPAAMTAPSYLPPAGMLLVQALAPRDIVVCGVAVSGWRGPR
jgi:hypothetical protein